MEETTVPLHSWFWLIIPMMTVFLLSIFNYLRYRGILPGPDKNGKGVRS